jgi:hypothetical protein
MLIRTWIIIKSEFGAEMPKLMRRDFPTHSRKGSLNGTIGIDIDYSVMVPANDGFDTSTEI